MKSKICELNQDISSLSAILAEVENFTRSINPIKDIKAFFEIKKIIKQYQIFHPN